MVVPGADVKVQVTVPLEPFTEKDLFPSVGKVMIKEVTFLPESVRLTIPLPSPLGVVAVMPTTSAVMDKSVGVAGG